MFGRIKNTLIARGYWEEQGGDGGAGGGGDQGSGEGGGSEGATGDKGTEGDKGDVGGLLGDAHKKSSEKEGGDKGGDKGGEGGKSENEYTLTLDTEDLEAIPEQFRKDGKINVDALVKGWKDTRQQLKNSKAKTPENADAYTFDMPQAAKDRGIELKNDDAMKAARAAAMEYGLSQDQFQGFLGKVLGAIADQVPQDIDPAKELSDMGENGQAQVDAALAWGNKLKEEGHLSESEFMEFLITGSTAAGVRMLNKLRGYAGEQPIPAGAGGVVEGLPSKEELYAAVASDKYQTDPSYRQKIDKQFEQVFGTEASGSSQPGLGVTARTQKAS